MDLNLICPCGRDIKFIDCCARIHNDIKLANTAEDLMRSRYSAFVVANVDYLLISHAKETRNTFNQKKTKNWTNSVIWNKLEIICTTNGLINDKDGYVEFKAFYIENGFLDCIHGKSRFVRDSFNNWMYLDELS
jgi:SEC-C motif domain protein